jgi:hypothetical protein
MGLKFVKTNDMLGGSIPNNSVGPWEHIELGEYGIALAEKKQTN